MREAENPRPPQKGEQHTQTQKTKQKQKKENKTKQKKTKKKTNKQTNMTAIGVGGWQKNVLLFLGSPSAARLL